MYTQKDFIIYLAGYIDGDGCFRLNTFTQKSGVVVYERSITITSVKEEVILFMKKILGGSIYEKEAKENRKTAYAWTIKGQASKHLAERIKPFLVIKEKESSIFIDLCELIEFNGFKKVPLKCIEKRNNLLSEIRKEIHENGLINKSSIIAIKKFKNSIEPTEEDHIYLAGIIDAEGCLRISSRHRKNRKAKMYNTVLEIGNSKIKLIEWLSKRFGGCIVYKQSTCTNRRNFAIWAIHAKSLYPILIKIKPLLINKKNVCTKLIEFQQTILPNGGDRHSISFKEEIVRLHLIRERIIEEVHKLNHKGNS